MGGNFVAYSNKAIPKSLCVERVFAGAEGACREGRSAARPTRRGIRSGRGCGADGL